MNRTLTYKTPIGHRTLAFLALSLASIGVVAEEPTGVLRAIAVDPDFDAQVYVAGGDKIFSSKDAGRTWQTSAESIEAWDLAIGRSENTVEGIAYAATIDLGILHSVDGGWRWNASDSNAGEARSLATSSDGLTVYAGATGDVAISTDQGQSFTRYSLGLDETGFVNAIAVDPQNTNVVYAALAGQGIYHSADGGQSWSLNNSGLFDNDVIDLQVDPANGAVLFASTTSGIFQSVDGGQVWIHLASPSLVNDMVIHPANPQMMLLATENDGINRSLDGGQSWHRITEGLQGIDTFTSLAVAADTGFVYAGTVQHGLFISSGNGDIWRSISDFAAETMPDTDDPVVENNVPPTNPTSLNIEVFDYQNGAGVPAGGIARYKITVENVGDNTATGVIVDPYWVRLRIFGSNDAMPYTVSATLGSCPTQRLCAFGDLPPGAKRSVEFSGTTKSGALTRYRLYANASADNIQSFGQTAEIGAIVTVFSSEESGGGSASPLLILAALVLLAIRALSRKRRDIRSDTSGIKLPPVSQPYQERDGNTTEWPLLEP